MAYRTHNCGELRESDVEKKQLDEVHIAIKEEKK